MNKSAPSSFQVHRNYLTKKELDQLMDPIPWIDWRPCPRWLGNFTFKIYGDYRNRPQGKLPQQMKEVAVKIAKLVPRQRFTTVFVQKYEKGQLVREHRDPKDNKGHTVVALFGNFEGAESTISGKKIKINAGDVLVQRCFIGNLPRPLHNVSPVTSGTRYALILNTISS